MVATSRHRDRALDRHEYFRGETLVRDEEDTNGDGRIDKWERYEGAVLREAAFDTSFLQGRADRRVLYDAKGRFAAVEAGSRWRRQVRSCEGEAATSPRPPGVGQ